MHNMHGNSVPVVFENEIDSMRWNESAFGLPLTPRGGGYTFFFFV